MSRPARTQSFLFVTWDGGGNLPPAIGLAHQLRSMGHRARFLGHASQRSMVEGAGLAFQAFNRTPQYDARVPIDPAAFAPFLWDHIIFEPLIADDLMEAMAAEATDAVMVDCMLTTPLAALEAADVPTAVLVHTLHRFFGGWDLAQIPASERLASLRSRLSLSKVADLQDTWRAADAVLVASPTEFDPSPAALPSNTFHVGPIVHRSQHEPTWDSDWGKRSDEPFVLVSLSTTSMEQEGLLNRVTEALSTFPARVLMTCGSGVDRGALRMAPNLTLREHIPHESVLPFVDLVVCHGGHGTVMSALAFGVPLVCIPMGRDQPMVAARVDNVGAGLSLEPNADPVAIREAVRSALGDPRVKKGAQSMAAVIKRCNGAVVAAQLLVEMGVSIEDFANRPATPACDTVADG